jgi:uncharacterized phage protein gp47/JayE
MAFVPRNFEQILSDMIAHMRANTTVTDYTVGSVARTLFEACALEDDEQYYQMVQLLDAFRIATAAGTDLDERAADYNITRMSPSSSSGEVVISDGGLVVGQLKFDAASGTPKTLYLVDSSDFPTAPFNVRIGEGTPEVEDCSVTIHNTSLNTITVAVLVNSHEAGARVSKKGGGDKTINSGVQVQVPAKGDNAAITYTTTTKVTLADGNYDSAPLPVKASTVGSKGNVGAGQISQFQGSAPFTGATVTNKTSTSGGRDLETDEELRARLLRRIRELSRGTVHAVESAAIGVTDSTTGQSIVTSKLREDFTDPYNNILYVDDGSGFTPSRVDMAQTSLSAIHLISVTTLQVNSVENFPDSGYVMVDPIGTSSEYIRYTSLGPGNVINLDIATTKAHASGQTVIYVEVVGVAEEGQNFFRLGNWPVLNHSLNLYDNNSGSFVQRIEKTEYYQNRTDGDLQYVGSGLLSGTVVLAHYSYYTGLLALVQKVITGDPNNRSSYPGVAAGGIMIHVGTPTIRRITVVITITAKNGYDEIQLRGEVQRDIEAYIEGLMIGDNVYRSRITEKAVRITGVENAVVTYPTADLVILENELPTPYDINGDSLVTVI